MSDSNPGGGLGPNGRQLPLEDILAWHHEQGMHGGRPVPNCPDCGPAEYARPLPQPLEQAAGNLARLMDWDVALAREVIAINAAAMVNNAAADLAALKAGLPWPHRTLLALAEQAGNGLDGARRWLLRWHPTRPG